ncbi:MAG: rhodanese-like domain-containing protein [Caldilineaceae bacterium]
MGFLSRLFGGVSSAHIAVADYKARYFDGKEAHILVDVRTAEEYKSGFIPGARNIPLQELGQKVNSLPRDKPIILYCRSGSRSASAAGMLKQAGFEQVYDLGGIYSWASSGYPIKTAGR